MTADTNHSSTPQLTHCPPYHFSRNPIKSKAAGKWPLKQMAQKTQTHRHTI